MTKNLITFIQIDGVTKIYINYDLAKQLKQGLKEGKNALVADIKR